MYLNGRAAPQHAVVLLPGGTLRIAFWLYQECYGEFLGGRGDYYLYNTTLGGRVAEWTRARDMWCFVEKLLQCGPVGPGRICICPYEVPL